MADSLSIQIMPVQSNSVYSKTIFNNDAKYRAAHRGHLIYLFALPLLPAFFSVLGEGDAKRMLAYGGCIAGFALAAFLFHYGVGKQQKAGVSRYRRVLTSGWVGLGGLLASFTWFYEPIYSGTKQLFYGVHGGRDCIHWCLVVLRVIRTEVSMQGALGYSAKEIASHLAEAEDQLQVIGQIKNRLEPGDIQQRLHRIIRKSGNVLRQIEADPGDLRRARKFLSVFLPGTRECV